MIIVRGMYFENSKKSFIAQVR